MCSVDIWSLNEPCVTCSKKGLVSTSLSRKLFVDCDKCNEFELACCCALVVFMLLAAAAAVAAVANAAEVDEFDDENDMLATFEPRLSELFS